MEKYWRFETSTVHAGHSPYADARSVAVPIHQTAAFAFEDTAQAAGLFDGKAEGFIYTRLGNPTTQVLEQRLATLEQGTKALLVSSGQAAVSCALMTIAGSGDNIVSASGLYGTTYSLFARAFRQYGIETRFCRHNDLAAFEKSIDAGTRAIFCESIANPSGDVADIAALAGIAQRHGIPLVVDNTLATPYLCRPFEHGADIVVHSLTKYIGGHGVALGGAVIDSGRFPWGRHASRFPLLSLPEHGRHGKSFLELDGEAAFSARCASVPLRMMGAVISPFNAFLVGLGLETLALRMDRICFNTDILARFLAQHEAVSWVKYPALPDHPDHALLQRYMGGRGSGVLSFGIKGDAQAGARFQDALSLAVRSTNFGDCKTLVCHPASTIHRQLSEAELADAGVSADLVRASVGIEHIEDLLEDFDRALGASQKEPVA